MRGSRASAASSIFLGVRRGEVSVPYFAALFELTRTHRVAP
jgi:hypothetical protein